MTRSGHSSTGSVGAGAPSGAQTDAPVNPCAAPTDPVLLCPDLVMAPPYDLTIDRRTRRGHVLLRAANSIDSLGRGPVELVGRRLGPASMSVSQRIRRAGGPSLILPTGGRLGFKLVPGQGRFWKLADAARFELWRLDARGRRTRLVRSGPKVFYCLRDLRRRHPRLGSPRRRVYPACSRNPRARTVTLGTSVGWSDVYPAGYHEQWIDVTGLRGRFAYVQVADPRNSITESNEANNAAEAIVRLPSGRAERRGRLDPSAPGAGGPGY